MLSAVTLWYIGVAVAIASQFISNLGSIIQKLSHLKEDDKMEKHRRTYAARPLWWIGMALVIAGSIGDFGALALAPQSIVATLGCLTLVAQVIWAPLILGERLTVRHYFSTGVIITGVVLALVFGPHTDASFDFNILIGRFKTTGFIIYATITLALAAAIFGVIKYIEAVFDLPTKPMLSDYFDDRTQRMNHSAGRFHRVAYGFLSGLVGAQSVLLGKCIAELIAMTAKSGSTVNMFTRAATYIVLLLLIVSVVGQIHFLNEGTARFQSLYVLPVFQATWTLTSVVGGLVVFNEWSKIDTTMSGTAALFIVGIGVTLLGVFYLMNTPAVTEVDRRGAKCHRCCMRVLLQKPDEDAPPPTPAVVPPPVDTTPLNPAAAVAASGGVLAAAEAAAAHAGRKPSFGAGVIAAAAAAPVAAAGGAAPAATVAVGGGADVSGVRRR